jgi:hypothetical protein
MSDLIGDLVSKLSIQESQAEGGAGLLLKLAQEKLGSDFSKIERVVPRVKDLISSIPKVGGTSKGIGGLLGNFGSSKAKGMSDFAGVESGFTQLKLESRMVAKFIQIILDFVKGKGAHEVTTLLSKAFEK